MAGEWLKFESSLPEKPETLAITVAMGWDDPDLTVGKLMRVFRWFDQQTINGNAKAVTPALLDRMIGTQGFVQAMADVDWVTVSPDGLALNNFEKHNGQTAKCRSETAKRVANHRARKAEKQAPEEGAYQRLCIPRPVRAAVLARDGNACVYCHRKDGEYGPLETPRDALMCLDHVVPLTRGGSDDMGNLVTACGSCNQFKSDRTPDECGLTWPTIDGKRLGNTSPVTPALAREEKRREEEKDTEAKASGGKPPIPKDVVFALGVPLLTTAGVPEKNARSFLAMQCKAHTDQAVADALEACARDRPVEPITWLQAHLKPNPSRGRHSGFSAKDYREGVTEDGTFS